MRKRIVFFLVMIFIINLVFLSACVEKTEYDNKEIVSIHYYTTESFLPWQDHKYYDFNEMTYSTKRIVAEGYEDPEMNPAFLEREDYTVKASFTEKQVKAFFRQIKRHGIYNFDKNYHNNDVHDGNSWHLTIVFSDETTYESGGYMKYPETAKKIDNDFFKLSGYKLFDLWE